MCLSARSIGMSLCAGRMMGEVEAFVPLVAEAGVEAEVAELCPAEQGCWCGRRPNTGPPAPFEN